MPFRPHRRQISGTDCGHSSDSTLFDSKALTSHVAWNPASYIHPDPRQVCLCDRIVAGSGLLLNQRVYTHDSLSRHGKRTAAEVCLSASRPSCRLSRHRCWRRRCRDCETAFLIYCRQVDFPSGAVSSQYFLMQRSMRLS